MKKPTFLFLFTMGLMAILPLQAQEKHTAPIPLVKEKWHWGQESQQNEAAGYAQVVKVGPTLYISGVPTRDFTAEGVAKLYQTLEKCLAAYGAGPQHVVKETLYTTDIERMKELNGVRKAFYQGDYPAASWVEVSRLYEPSAQLEVDLIAVLMD